MTKRNPNEILTELPLFAGAGLGVPLTAPPLPEALRFYPQESTHRRFQESRFMHDRHIFIFLLEGRIDFRLGTVNYALDGGEFFLIPPYVEHSFPGNEGNSYRAVFASCRFSNDGSPLDGIAGKSWKFDRAEKNAVFRCAGKFIDACGGDPYAGREAALCFSLLLNRMLRRRVPLPRSEIAANARSHRDELLRQILTIIHEHPVRSLRPAEIARKLKISVSLVRQIFRDRMNTPIGRYICSKSLDAALELAKSSGLSFSEIALRTGFSSESALAKAVRREEGHSLGEHRRGQERRR